MNKNGPVIIIEDDEDDQFLMKEVFERLNYPNEIIPFTDGQDALEYLNRPDVNPFLILSDINMPKMDGLALRSKILVNAALQVKCTPYLFFTTASTQSAVIEAYSLSVQGFFVKESSLEELESTLSLIMQYWRKCKAPSNFSF